MHHVLANSSTGYRAVNCGRKNGVSGQPIAVALRWGAGIAGAKFYVVGNIIHRLHRASSAFGNCRSGGIAGAVDPFRLVPIVCACGAPDAFP